MNAVAPPPDAFDALKAELFGRAYELFVKRGVLYCLIERGVVPPDHFALEPWLDFAPADVLTSLYDQLDIVDDAGRQQLRDAIDHIAHCAFLSGYCAIRAWLNALPHKPVACKALFAPFALLDQRNSKAALCADIIDAFGIPLRHEPERLAEKGMPANADFAIQILDAIGHDHLLVLEFSNLLAPRLDFTAEAAHIAEVQQRQNLIDARGVFTRIAAEVDGDSFKLSPGIAENLNAFTTSDKPLYKLCQACAYAAALARLMLSLKKIKTRLHVRALAITPVGLESLAASFCPSDQKPHDIRASLMNDLRNAYIDAKPADTPFALRKAASKAFDAIAARLPAAMRDAVQALKITPGQGFRFAYDEAAPDYFNPATKMSDDQIAAVIPKDLDLDALLGAPAASAMIPQIAPAKTLRDLHAAAIIAGMQAARKGRINTIALEGNPGIGKTTAVRTYLKSRPGGFLFFYISPRVGINNEVFSDIAGPPDTPNGILTITSNSELNRSAKQYAETRPDVYGTERTDRAVKVEGISGLDQIKRHGSLIYVRGESEEDFDRIIAPSEQKKTISATEDEITRRRTPGVLTTICSGARHILSIRPDVDKIAITAAIQTLRTQSDGTRTTASLAKLFRNPVTREAGISERRAFAKRCPVIVAMIDELAGDGAGAPFIHALADWLEQEFIEPFDGYSPFTVILIPSDASLASDEIMRQYLASEDQAPDKVLIAPSKGSAAFNLSARSIKLNGREAPCLHVMTNSFPAAQLSFTYKITLTPVEPIDKSSGLPIPAHKAIRAILGDEQADAACREIYSALKRGSRQCIYFAQDKLFLSALHRRILADEDAAEFALTDDNVKILDSSVPVKTRHKMMEPNHRDVIRIFLMTSSGSRGLSFPLTDTIIATMPRFKPEAALMELSQLIYRGRGRCADRSSLDTTAHRRLIFLIDDAILKEPKESLDTRAWLRQATDLLTFIVMLRATLLTRITGDSCLANKMAFVPVGGISIDEAATLMTENLGNFLKEADIAIARDNDKEDDQAGLLTAAKDGVLRAFGMAEIIGQVAGGTETRSYTNRTFRQNLKTASLTDPLRGLHLRADPANPLVPENLYFAGPLAFEKWREIQITEAFRIDTGSSTIDIDALKAQLYRISKDFGLPSKTRQAAGSLYEYLKRPVDSGSFRFRKTIDSNDLLLSLPIGFDDFANHIDISEASAVNMPAEWLSVLSRSLGWMTKCLPAIALYRDFPFSAAMTKIDPIGGASMFSERYFMASEEFNLLNTLFLSQ